MLLGNVGIPGGGINALRGESNVQGSTDQGLLAHVLPAYLPVPTTADPNPKTYIDNKTKPGGAWSGGYWTNGPKFITSLLKAWWGPYAVQRTDFAYRYLPNVDNAANHYWIALFEAMLARKIKGLWIMGINPAAGGPNVFFHDPAMIVSICIFLIHLYLAVAHPLMWDGLVSIRFGVTSAAYAAKHHAKWFYGPKRAMETWEAKMREATQH